MNIIIFECSNTISKKSLVELSPMQYWLVLGNPENWEIAFKHGYIWGLRESQRHLWNSINEDDVALFYATSPVKGIIGYGAIRTKFKQDKPLWPQETKENKVIWPLRFEFDVEYCLPQDRWLDSKVVPEVLRPRLRSGFQSIDDELAKELISSVKHAPEQKAVEEPIPVTEGAPVVLEKKAPSHDELIRVLIEIGRLQKFLVEKEYPVDGGRLDAVWRRVERSVPTYVFEVQVGGDLYHALAKLKHAYDLWNSHIFLIAGHEDRDKVNQLLSGSFHEIHDQLKFIDDKKVEQLYNLKRSYYELETELGIK